MRGIGFTSVNSTSISLWHTKKLCINIVILKPPWFSCMYSIIIHMTEVTAFFLLQTAMAKTALAFPTCLRSLSLYAATISEWWALCANSLSPPSFQGDNARAKAFHAFLAFPVSVTLLSYCCPHRWVTSLLLTSDNTCIMIYYHLVPLCIHNTQEKTAIFKKYTGAQWVVKYFFLFFLKKKRTEIWIIKREVCLQTTAFCLVSLWDVHEVHRVLCEHWGEGKYRG